jgi:hypothetical protein
MAESPEDFENLLERAAARERKCVALVVALCSLMLAFVAFLAFLEISGSGG